MSNLVKIITASNEAEAMMYEELLRKNGIGCQLRQDNSSGALRGRIGGAGLPIEFWEISVRAEDAQKAKEILPDQPFQRNISTRKRIAGWVYIIYCIVTGVIAYFVIKWVI